MRSHQGRRFIGSHIINVNAVAENSSLWFWIKKDLVKVAALLEDGVPVTVASSRDAQWPTVGDALSGLLLAAASCKLCLVRQTLNGAESLQSRYLSAPHEPPRKQQGFMSTPPPPSCRVSATTRSKVSTNLNANMFEAHLRLIGLLSTGMQGKVAGVYSWKMKRIRGGELRAVQLLHAQTRDSLHQK